MEEFNLTELLNKVVDGMKRKTSVSNITVLVNSSRENITLFADRGAIRELLTILLDNAIKFNKKDGSVEVSLKELGRDVIIEVKDTGMGISEKDLPFVFDRFYKTDSARTRRKTDGFGLGLSIAKEIVVLHKGTIDVKSLVDEGSVFSVKLPSKCSQTSLRKL